MKRSEKLRQIGIGVQLRKLREEAGMTTRSVASSLGLSASTVNRTELGSRVPDRDEMSALCALYGVTGEAKRELIERVGEVGEAAAWLESARVSDIVASLMVLERESVSMTYSAVALVPGLAQTADYARTVLGTHRDETERKVATRLGRQAVLSRPNAPTMTMFIEEGALHRTLGNPRMLREQLEQLLVLQRRNNVSVRVIPFDAVQSPANGGPFVLYELADGSHYVFVEAFMLGVFVTDSSEVAPFVETSRLLEGSALDEAGSNALIRKIAEGLTDD